MDSKRERRTYHGWAHITRAEDVPGEWVAYCPDFDVMTQGDSPEHARAMIEEAVGILVALDLNEGRDPEARRSTRPEDWEPLERLFNAHKDKVAIDAMDDRSEFSEFAVPISWTFVREMVVDGHNEQAEFLLVPSLAA